MTPNTWTRSTYCANGACLEICQGGSCIEAAVTSTAVHVRDTKLADSPILTFDPDAWRGFLNDLRAGQIGADRG